MGKRKVKAKRSLAALPKGLPSKRSDCNPFEVTKKHRRPKHEVLNRFSSTKTQKKPSKLAESLQRRQSQLRASLNSKKKVNSFVDRRIGEYTMSQEDQILARLVKERTRRSQKVSKYSLDDEEINLTHKGKAINQMNEHNHIILSSDDEDGGDLDAVDTELHFGGISTSKNPYGPANGRADMSQLYAQRKNDLDDMINRRKQLKAEKMMSKEKQVGTFESMDDSFKELSKLLQFRDKEREYQIHLKKKREGELTAEDKEMADWDKEMKTYMFERKVKATDRIKTPEEIAKEEAERLHELETKRLARMNGDFEDDDLSDISEEERRSMSSKKKSRKTKDVKSSGPEALDDFDSDIKKDGLTAKFTADGIVFVDADGNIVKKNDEIVQSDEDDSKSDDDDDDDGDSSDETDDDDEKTDEENDDCYRYDPNVILSIGARVKGNYHADEQIDGDQAWYEGSVVDVSTDKAGNTRYSVEYDDGDFEEGMKPENVRPMKKSDSEKLKEDEKNNKAIVLKRKRRKATDKARKDIPYVFEVPTTLEALHVLIGKYAVTGNDASLIVERIHTSNSVRLDKRNSEKMQNFYDVVLRRFLAVGDAIYLSGDGGKELNRYEQLNSLTRTLYSMSQDAPEHSGAVWVRRLGILQSAHAKRLRDSEFVRDDDNCEDLTAWPSTGTILLLRTLGHLFPVTDFRHHVVTPAMLLLGQFVAQTPITSLYDLTMGLICTALLIEYTRDAKRIVPEAMGFLSGVLRLFAGSSKYAKVPNLNDNILQDELRETILECSKENTPLLSFEKLEIERNDMSSAILYSALNLVNQCIEIIHGSILGAERETFSEVLNSLLSFKESKSQQYLSKRAENEIIELSSKLLKLTTSARKPLLRRAEATKKNMTLKALAPRMEDPLRYTMSKDKGKTSIQAAHDRMRREYKREHKAVSRELRMDGAFVEAERRRDEAFRDGAARAKRQKNFAWLEGEQATMNQQVRLGGGLLSGGGMGAARAKVKSAKMGIKKGGKF